MTKTLVLALVGFVLSGCAVKRPVFMPPTAWAKCDVVQIRGSVAYLQCPPKPYSQEPLSRYRLIKLDVKTGEFLGEI